MAKCLNSKPFWKRGIQQRMLCNEAAGLFSHPQFVNECTDFEVASSFFVSVEVWEAARMPCFFDQRVRDFPARVCAVLIRVDFGSAL